MKKLKYLILIVSLSAFVSSAQDNDTIKTRPVQVTFFYPIGTNGLESPTYTNQFSFNVLSGVNGGVDGVEIGGISNVNTGDVNGLQIAGIANVDMKSANGLVISGIANVIKDSSQSICVAGISNVVGGSSLNTGLQVAGISNLNNSDYIGGQIGGIVNLNNGSLKGVQIAGISNVNNGNLEGTQVSGISNFVNGDLSGTQIGLVNKAKNVKGFQLGLINVANDFESGVPLGLFSFVKNGYHAVELSTSDAIYTNLNFKMGVDKLYTIYKVGFTAGQDDNYVTYGLGLGTKINLTDRFNLSIEGSSNHIIKSGFTPNFDLLCRADVAVRYNLNKHFSVFAGPSFNVYLSEYDLDSESTALKVPYSLYSKNWWNNNGSTSIWIGGTAGVSVAF